MNENMKNQKNKKNPINKQPQNKLVARQPCVFVAILDDQSDQDIEERHLLCYQWPSSMAHHSVNVSNRIIIWNVICFKLAGDNFEDYLPYTYGVKLSFKLYLKLQNIRKMY